LGQGAVIEGLGERPHGFRKRVLPKLLRRQYENILTATLIYDGAATIAPNIGPSRLDRLCHEYDLVRPIDVSSATEFELRVARAYELGFVSFRRREERADELKRRITATGISTPRESLDKHLADIEDDDHMALAMEMCVEYARSFLSIWHLTQGGGFEHSWVNQTGALTDYLGDHESVLGQSDDEPTLQEQMLDVLERLPFHMGLYFDEQRVDQERSGGDPVFFNFDPAQMREMFTTDELLAAPRSDWSTHAQQGLLLGMRPSPAKFLACHTLWRTIFEFSRLIDFADEFNTQLLASPSASRRKTSPPDAPGSGERVRAYQLLSDTLPTVPRVSTISELLRLRDDPNLPRLRECIKEWANSVVMGDGKACSKIAKDVASAGKAFERARRIKQASQTLNYVTIPVCIAEALAGTCYGLLLLPIGPCLDLIASRIVRRNSWIQFGVRA